VCKILTYEFGEEETYPDHSRGEENGKSEKKNPFLLHSTFSGIGMPLRYSKHPNTCGHSLSLRNATTSALVKDAIFIGQ
jgi:hypothetical protein